MMTKKPYEVQLRYYANRTLTLEANSAAHAEEQALALIRTEFMLNPILPDEVELIDILPGRYS